MNISTIYYLNVSKKHLFSSFILVLISYFPLQAQIKYLPVNEYKDAAMGVERVARFFTAAYESKLAQKDDEIRWVQVDLGKRGKIDGIKLLPKINPWNNVISEGFPSRFKIEVSDDADFEIPAKYTKGKKNITIKIEYSLESKKPWAEYNYLVFSYLH